MLPALYSFLEGQAAQHKPMAQLLLHIGHPKTGTTALQSVLSANAEALLKKASVLYPTRTVPSEFKHALAIPWLFRVDNESIRKRARSSGDELRERSRQYWDSLTAEVRQSNHDLLILSAEGFWDIPRSAPREQTASARDRLYEIANQIRIVAYVRSPTAYFLSRMNQKLRNFLPPSLPKPDYYSSAMRGWEDLGFDDYSWRVFDKSLLIKSDIVDDFCASYLPGSLRFDALQREGVERANSSVSSEALVILEELAVNHPILGRDRDDRRRAKIVSILRGADAKVGGRSSPTLLESARLSIIGCCSDLDWLQKRGISFPDIEPALVGHHQTKSFPETFTSVSDYCRVDAERLARLRAASRKIEALFPPKSQRFFWPFRRCHHL